MLIDKLDAKWLIVVGNVSVMFLYPQPTAHSVPHRHLIRFDQKTKLKLKTVQSSGYDMQTLTRSTDHAGKFNLTDMIKHLNLCFQV